MFIRFEVAGQGIWTAPWDVAAPADRAWRWSHKLGKGARRIRRMKPETQHEYHFLLAALTRDLDSPPAHVYAAKPGFRCITFFRMAGPTHDQNCAGWQAITLLREHGWPAYEVFRHKPPGRVTFQDERQIVVAIRAPKPRHERGGWNGDRATIRRWKESEPSGTD
ncbi:MAG: hypothetical protein HEQ23_10280 [Tepidisphaera sp.]